MGTNFFWLKLMDKAYGKDRGPTDNPEIHIGKRSAAGWYCWDCGLTLCKDGAAGLHGGKSGWYDTCPECGKAPQKEGMDESTGGLELGFARAGFQEHEGVRSVSSFTYAQDPEAVQERLLLRWRVVDEYEREYTADEFQKLVLDHCPFTFQMIGEWFF